MDYKNIYPRSGIIAVKAAEEEKSALKKAGQSESNAYGEIIAINPKSSLEIGQTIVYNEYEGQELMRYKAVDEDGIIIIKEENILAIIVWD